MRKQEMKNKFQKKNNRSKDRMNTIRLKYRDCVAVLLGICIMGGTLTGCGFAVNPMQYMKSSDESLVAKEQEEKNNASGDAVKEEVKSQPEMTDNKVVVIGTYGSISDMIDADSYSSLAYIELVQETRDFDETSDMLELVKKVQESCDTDAEAVILSVRSRVYAQITYLLQNTINTSKAIIVICEDEKNTDYNKIFTEALNTAVDSQDYKANAENDSAYTVIKGLKAVEVIDVSGVSSLPYVNIVYDYIGNDIYTAEKVFDTSEAVVVVTESRDGSLSSQMAQLVRDVSDTIPVVIVGVNEGKADYNNCIYTNTMTAEQARIMAMLWLTRSKNISDWQWQRAL